MHSTLIVLFCYVCTEIHDETVQVPSINTCPSLPLQGTATFSHGRYLCSGRYVKFVVEQSETVNQKTVCSIDQIMMKA